MINIKKIRKYSEIACLTILCSGLFFINKTYAVFDELNGAPQETRATSGVRPLNLPQGILLGNAAKPQLQEPKKPEYSPAQLIIKFKPTVGAQAGKLFKEGKALKSVSGTDTLDKLNKKHKVKKMERIFKGLVTKGKAKGKEFITAAEQAQELNRKFPQRAKRARKDAKIPDLENIYLLELEDPQTNILQIAKEYKQDASVVYAQPNYIYKAVMQPNDPYYSSSNSWNQGYDDLWGLKKIRAEQAWDISQGDDVVVAVVDTGVDYNHEDIQANMWTDASGKHGFDFANSKDANGDGDFTDPGDVLDSNPMDDNGHGTHVAGIIAAERNNAKGVIGVAPRAKIMAVKSLSAFGGGNSDGLSQGIEYAVDQGAAVINNSWVADIWFPVDLFIEETINYAYANGCVVVFAAGNDNKDVAYFVPPNNPEVITVGASDINDDKSSFSNYGDKIDIVAPGGSRDWHIIKDDRAQGGAYAQSNLPNASVVYYSPGYVPGARHTIIGHIKKGPDQGIAKLQVLAYSYNSYFGFWTYRPVYEGTFDNYAPTEQFASNQVTFTLPPHSLDVYYEYFTYAWVVTNTKNAAASNSYVSLDAVVDNDVSRQEQELSLETLENIGQDILSLKAANAGIFYPNEILGGEYARASGTSMAAPFVSGAAALVLSTHPDWTIEQVKSSLCLGAIDVGTLGKDAFTGYGRLDLLGALEVQNPISLPRAIILFPEQFQLLSASGQVDITGTVFAEDTYFQNYSLAVAPMPHKDWKDTVAWTNLANLTVNSIFDSPVYRWDYRNLNDGYYLLKLTTYAKDPRNTAQNVSASDTKVVHIGNKIKPGWPFQNYANFTRTVLVNLDNDVNNTQEIITAIEKDGKTNLLVFNADGTERFSIFTTEPGGIFSWYDVNNPSVGDIDDDGGNEIVIVAGGKLWAWHADGTAVVNWQPLLTDVGLSGTPVLADMNNDEVLDVITYTSNSIPIFEGNGSLLSNWSVETTVHSPPAVGDINRDGKNEIVILGRNLSLYSRPAQVIAYDQAGVVLWAKTIPDNNHVTLMSPIIGDVDGNEENGLEIVAAYEGTVSAFYSNGDLLPGWPFDLDNSFLGSTEPVLADINQDGLPEIIVLTTGPYGLGNDGRVHVININAQALAKWPLGNTGESSPVVGDINGDNQQEIVVGSLDRQLNAWNKDGVLVPGFPMDLGAAVDTTPALGDTDSDGKVDLLTDTGVRIKLADPVLLNEIDWPSLYSLTPGGKYNSWFVDWGQFRHDPQHTGCYQPHVDTTPPTGSATMTYNKTIPGMGVLFDLKSSVTETGSGMGTGAQIATQYVFNNGLPPSAWVTLAYATTIPVLVTDDTAIQLNVKWKDLAENWSTPITVAIPDKWAPRISNGAPTGILPPDRTQETLSVTTNVNATCQYYTPADPTLRAFATTGGTTHTKPITGLTKGTSYKYYVRCQDAAGNVNSPDYDVNFSVAAMPAITPARVTVNSGQTVNMTFSVPEGIINTGCSSQPDGTYTPNCTQLYMSCAAGVTVSLGATANICNSWRHFPALAPNSQTLMSFVVKNSTASVQKPVPNFYVTFASRPNYSYGTSGEITINSMASLTSATASLNSASTADKVGIGAVFTPANGKDWNIVLNLNNIPANTQIKSIRVTNLGGSEYWYTDSSVAWALGVFNGTQQINYKNASGVFTYGTPLQGTYQGSKVLNLYGQKNGTTFLNASVRIVFSDDSVRTITIPTSSPSPSPSGSPSS